MIKNSMTHTELTIPITMTILPTISESTFEQQNMLTEKIMAVNNSIEVLNNQIGKNRMEVNRNEHILKQLEHLLVNYGSDASIRLKNDKFKLGQGKSLLKNLKNRLIHRNNYKRERRIAVNYFYPDSKVKEISITMAISKTQQDIRGLYRELALLNYDKEQQKTELNTLSDALHSEQKS